jgi:putative membrane protein
VSGDDPAGADSTSPEPTGLDASDFDGTAAVDGPRNLSKLTIPYRLAQQGLTIALFLFFAGIPGMTAVFGRRGGLVGIVGVVGLAAAAVGYAVVWYRRYEYELTADTFDIRSGVFSRREREIPLRRIQNVDISQSVVQRVLGLAVVGLETAGGGETEAQLKYVAEEEADRLQAEVSRLRRASEGTSGDSEPEPTETVFAITERELGVLALVSTDFRVVSLLFFGASLAGPQAFDVLDDAFVASPESLVGALVGPVAGLLGVLVLGLVSGAINAARYYGFTLARGEDELRYERGLLQRYSGTIPLSKVQTLTIRENLLARRLGYAALSIETAGHVATGGDGGGSQSAIPLAERDRVVELARSLEPATLDTFERPPRRARRRYAARYALALLGIAGLVALVTTTLDLRPYWLVPVGALVLVPMAAHLKWRHRGYVLGEDHVVTRNGFWTRRTKVVPYHRVQTTVSTETIFQRRRDLGTVVVDTAGAQSFGGDDPRAVDVDVTTADELRETVADNLYRALRARKRTRRKTAKMSSDPERQRPGGVESGD